MVANARDSQKKRPKHHPGHTRIRPRLTLHEQFFKKVENEKILGLPPEGRGPGKQYGSLSGAESKKRSGFRGRKREKNSTN